MAPAAAKPNEKESFRVQEQPDPSLFCTVCMDHRNYRSHGKTQRACGHYVHDMCLIKMENYGFLNQCPRCLTLPEDVKKLTLEHINAEATQAFFQGSYEKCAASSQQVLDMDGEHPQACIFLAEMHFTGRGVVRNIGKAYELAMVAHRKGVQAAAVLLARIYLEDESTGIIDEPYCSKLMWKLVGKERAVVTRGYSKASVKR